MLVGGEMIKDRNGLMQTTGTKEWWTILGMDHTINEGEPGRYWIEARGADGVTLTDGISFGSREAALEHMLNAIEFGLKDAK